MLLLLQLMPLCHANSEFCVSKNANKRGTRWHVPGHLLPGKCMLNSRSHFTFLDKSVFTWSPFSLLQFSSRPAQAHGLNKHYVYTKITKRVSYLLSLCKGRFLYKC